MKVLVTGSSGFIGGHLIKLLRHDDHEVIEADLKQGKDLSEPAIAHEVFVDKPDLVFHLAGLCSTPGSVTDPAATFRDIVSTAANVIEEARLADVPVILTSSVKARDGQTPYGAAKRMVELWATEYRIAYDLPVVIVRPGTVYGPGQEGSPDSGWIAWFLKAQKESIRVTINGDGRQVRDLLHVDDLVRLYKNMMYAPESYATKTWDVGGGMDNAVSVIEMADHLGLAYDLGPPRYGDVAAYVGINDVPGWTPLIRWQDALGNDDYELPQQPMPW